MVYFYHTPRCPSGQDLPVKKGEVRRVRKCPEISSFGLHLLAMGLMLCDHIGLAFAPQALWMRCVGRLAFPIFAFLAAEGFRRTRSRAGYARRLALGALLSEIPYDLLVFGRPFHWSGQNVLWTLLIALGCMELLERARAAASRERRAALAGVALLGGYLAGEVFRTDYFGPGVWMVLVFYLFSGGGRQRLGQLAGLVLVNALLPAGPALMLTAGPVAVVLPIQHFAVLALGPLWLYQGRQGLHGRWTRLLCYGFYPVHLLVLAALRTLF